MSMWGDVADVMRTDDANLAAIEQFRRRLSPPSEPAEGPVRVTDLTEMDAAEFERIDLDQFDDDERSGHIPIR